MAIYYINGYNSEVSEPFTEVPYTTPDKGSPNFKTLLDALYGILTDGDTIQIVAGEYIHDIHPISIYHKLNIIGNHDIPIYIDAGIYDHAGAKYTNIKFYNKRYINKTITISGGDAEIDNCIFETYDNPNSTGVHILLDGAHGSTIKNSTFYYYSQTNTYAIYCVNTKHINIYDNSIQIAYSGTGIGVVSDSKTSMNIHDNIIYVGQKTLLDYDNNEYRTIVIGEQEWTIDNWRCTTYNDGTRIPTKIYTESEWNSLTTPAYCSYDNSTNSSFIEKYGLLYNWYVIDPNNPMTIAPNGWRVPTEDDWNTLINYLISNGFNYDGTISGNKIAKCLSSDGGEWQDSTIVGSPGNDKYSNNSTLFSVLPSGARGNGNFIGKNYDSAIWSTTSVSPSFSMLFQINYDIISVISYAYTKYMGASIRLVRDL